MVCHLSIQAEAQSCENHSRACCQQVPERVATDSINAAVANCTQAVTDYGDEEQAMMCQFTGKSVVEPCNQKHEPKERCQYE